MQGNVTPHELCFVLTKRENINYIPVMSQKCLFWTDVYWHCFDCNALPTHSDCRSFCMVMFSHWQHLVKGCSILQLHSLLPWRYRLIQTVVMQYLAIIQYQLKGSLLIEPFGRVCLFLSVRVCDGWMRACGCGVCRARWAMSKAIHESGHCSFLAHVLKTHTAFRNATFCCDAQEQL